MLKIIKCYFISKALIMINYRCIFTIDIIYYSKEALIEQIWETGKRNEMLIITSKHSIGYKLWKYYGALLQMALMQMVSNSCQGNY